MNNESWQCGGCKTWYAPTVEKCECQKSLSAVEANPPLWEGGLPTVSGTGTVFVKKGKWYDEQGNVLQGAITLTGPTFEPWRATAAASFLDDGLALRTRMAKGGRHA